jgi:hypothetical protein
MKLAGKKVMAITATSAFCAVIGIVATMIWSDDLDVVRKNAQTTFQTLMETWPPQATETAWSIIAPDGAAKFEWSATTVALKVDITPFVAAGLDASQLPNVENGELVWRRNFANNAQLTTPQNDSAQMMIQARDAIGYHAALGHFGVTIGEGNLFEWAQDMRGNDKDLVFVLNPEPLLIAGVNPDAVDGWSLALVPVDENGKTIEVTKFLKPFNLINSK